MATHAAAIHDRTVFAVTGAEAKPFLQGLLTCNLDNVSENIAQAGALLSPQGKILFDATLIATNDGYLVETAASQREAFIKRLQFYKLRAKVTIEACNDLHVFALWGNNDAEGFTDPRWPALGQRLYAKEVATNASEDTYHTHRIAEGIPEAEKDYILGDTFPHEANFDLLNGADFNKGCYVGQEVVSRMQHRGVARKRILPFEMTGDAAPRTPIMAGDITLGELGSSSSGRVLGLVRLDKLEDALCAKKTIQAGHATLNPVQPAWANFMIAGNAA
ncbi:MAG: folate-binding protein [Pseudomonadota bacterium]